MGVDKFTRYYLSSLLTKEVKHDMLSFFYRGDKEIVKDLKTYVEVKSDSHYQRAYTKDEDLRKLLNEVQDLKVGTIDFENVI